MPTTVSKKHFNRMRAIAIVALVLTTILFVFLMFESSLTSQESGSLTAMFYDLFRPAYENVEVVPDTITLRSLSLSAPDYKSTDRLFPGDTVQLKVRFSPAGAEEAPYHFKFVDQYGDPIPEEEITATVDQNGLVTFTDISSLQGVKVQAFLDSDESVYSNIVTLFSYGVERPTADTVFDFCLKDKKDKLWGTEDNPLTVGRRLYLTINDGDYRCSLFDVVSDNEDVAVYKGGSILAVGAGKATFTATLDLDGNHWEYTFDVYTKEKQSSGDSTPSVIAPEFISAPESVDVMVGEPLDLSDCGLEFYPDNCAKGVETIPYETDVARVTEHGVIGKDEGTVTMTVVSTYDSNVTTTIIVNVRRPEVEYVDILTDSSVSIYGSAKLVAYVGPKYADDEVIWSVVSGDAYIDEKGRLQPEMLGPVTVRATSATNPGVYAEKTIEVKLFTEFASFVRKIMGHFALYAALGLGLMATYYFLARRKYLAPIFAGASGIIAACITELIQKFTEGRSGLWVDVMVDSMGVFFGMGVGMVLVGIVCAVWRAISAESFRKTAVAYRYLNFSNVFRSKATIDMLFSADVYVRKQHHVESNDDAPQDVDTSELTAVASDLDD